MRKSCLIGFLIITVLNISVGVEVYYVDVVDIPIKSPQRTIKQPQRQRRPVSNQQNITPRLFAQPQPNRKVQQAVVQQQRPLQQRLARQPQQIRRQRQPQRRQQFQQVQRRPIQQRSQPQTIIVAQQPQRYQQQQRQQQLQKRPIQRQQSTEPDTIIIIEETETQQPKRQQQLQNQQKHAQTTVQSAVATSPRNTETPTDTIIIIEETETQKPKRQQQPKRKQQPLNQQKHAQTTVQAAVATSPRNTETPTDTIIIIEETETQKPKRQQQPQNQQKHTQTTVQPAVATSPENTEKPSSLESSAGITKANNTNLSTTVSPTSINATSPVVDIGKMDKVDATTPATISSEKLNNASNSSMNSTGTSKNVDTSTLSQNNHLPGGTSRSSGLKNDSISNTKLADNSNVFKNDSSSNADLAVNSHNLNSVPVESSFRDRGKHFDYIRWFSPHRPQENHYRDFAEIYNSNDQKAETDYNLLAEKKEINDDFNGRCLVAPGQYPHMAALGYRSSAGETEFMCGGSLISDMFVLTAAHCCYLNGQAPHLVEIGDVNLKDYKNYLMAQRRGIARVIKHPYYNESMYYNDIGLLELTNPIDFTDFVRPIRLWAKDELPYNKLFTMGYGSTSFAKAPTNVLTELDLSLVTLKSCNRTMPPDPHAPYGIRESQICAKDFEKNRDTCQGDSGGPLQLNLERPKRHIIRYYLVGIISYGTVCRSEHPGVYTKVSSFIDWIASEVWPEYFDNF